MYGTPKNMPNRPYPGNTGYPSQQIPQQQQYGYQQAAPMPQNIGLPPSVPQSHVPSGPSYFYPSVEKMACMAWNPIPNTHQGLLALGGCEPGGSLDFVDSLDGFRVCSSTSAYSAPFRCIGWTETLSQGKIAGLVAGGHEDGSVSLWEPSTNSPPSCMLSCPVYQYNAPINALQFNPSKPSLLAAGSAEGELVLIDIGEQPSQPQLTHLLPSSSSQGGIPAGITSIGWNPKVPHILASAADDGTIVIFDSRTGKETLTFNGGGKRASSVCWNPLGPTQVAVSLDDDTRPCIQLWELRKIQSPMKDFSAHSKGILSLSWSEIDGNFLVSSGRDNKTICWLYKDGNLEAFSDLLASTVSSSPAFQVGWSPLLSGSVASCLISGKVVVENVMSRPHYPISLRHVPKWLQYSSSSSGGGGSTTPSAVLPSPSSSSSSGRGVGGGGCSISFSGKLFSFSTRKPGVVSMVENIFDFLKFSDEPLLATGMQEDAAELEALELCLEKGALRDFCQFKANSASSSPSMTWNFLNRLFARDPSERRKLLLESLGYSKERVHALANEILGPASHRLGSSSCIPQSPSNINNPTAITARPSPPPSEGLGEDPQQLDSIFDQLGQKNERLQSQISSKSAPHGLNHPFLFVPPLASPPSSPSAVAGHVDEWSNGGPLTLIKQSVLVGDLRTAIECCLKHGREADALLIAAGAGEELWQFARNEYIKSRKSEPFVKTISLVINNELHDLVNISDLSNWQDSLALIATFCQKQEEIGGLCERLGQRLEDERADSRSALLCYIAAGSFKHSVRIWTLQERAAVSSSPTITIANSNIPPSWALVERMVVLYAAIASKTPEDDKLFSDKVTAFAEHLASTGRAKPALRLLSLVPASSVSSRASFLRDRIYQSNPQSMIRILHNPPPLPFQPVEVVGSSSSRQQQRVVGNTPVAATSSFPGSYSQSPATMNRSVAGFNNPPPPAAPVQPHYVSSSPSPPIPPPPPPPLARPQLPRQPTPSYYSQQPLMNPNTSLALPGTGSAPHVGAMTVTDGLPVPHPIPTPSQLSQYSNTATVQKNMQINRAASIDQGPMIVSQDLALIQRVLGNLLMASAQDGNKKKFDDLTKRFEELYERLSSGKISEGTQTRLIALCRAAESGDWSNVTRLRVELSSMDWESNRSWIMAVKMILPK